MAKSLDELIEYLLNEIAVCGPGGVSIQQVTEFVEAFYNDGPSLPEAANTAASTEQKVDDALIAQVWQCLGKHPDVSIGKKHQFDDTPLQDFETPSDPSDESLDWRSHVPKIFVSEELIFRSLCGQVSDQAKLFPSEYALLCKIAAARADGILQGDLGRATGQDKRSVPKRTDVLQAKGFIVKQPVYVRGTKTSLLILRRYVKDDSSFPKSSKAVESGDLSDAATGQELLVRDIFRTLVREDPDRIVASSSEEAVLPTKEPPSNETNTDISQEIVRTPGLANAGVDEVEAGLANSAELTHSVQADDLQHRPGEPKAALNGEGVESTDILGDEEQQTETEDSEGQTRRHSRRRKVKRKILLSDDDERPQGRPRRFVRGTEKFWQHQFWQAKVAAVREGDPPPTKDGTMHDPAGLAVFENRPDDFDETLVEAKAAGLPLPAIPDEITDEWVRLTQTVLQRSDFGAYVTPVGMYLGRIKYRSQLLIVRSVKLGSVDWCDRTKIPAFRFISSSNAHSYHYQRYYPQLAKAQLLASRKTRKSPLKARRVSVQKDTDGQKRVLGPGPGTGPGPELGVFVDAVSADAAASPTLKPQTPGLPPRTTPDYNQYMDTTESDSGLNGVRGSIKQAIRSKRKQARTPKDPSHVRERRQSSVMPLGEAAHNLPPQPPFSDVGEGKTPAISDSGHELDPKPQDNSVLSVKDQTSETEQHAGGAHEEMTSIQSSKLHAAKSTIQVEISKTRPAVHVNGQLGEDHHGPAREEDVMTTSVGPAHGSQKRKRRSSSASSDMHWSEAPVKRQRRGRDRSGELCQNVIFELVELAGGAAPNNRSTLRRCMARRWQAGGGKDRPLIKPIKAAVKNLTASGRLKEHIFSFRGKGGVLIRRYILHLPGVDAASSQILELKKKIIDADAIDYIPPEWAEEAQAALSNPKNRLRSLSNAERAPPSPIPAPYESSEGPTTPLHDRDTIVASPSGSTRPKRMAKRRRVHDESLVRSPEPTASPELEASATTGFLTLIVPGLRHLRQVQEFNSALEEPSWKALLHPVTPKFNTKATSSNPTALPTLTSQRKSGLRRQKGQTKHDETTRKIIWAAPEQVIPEDLDHLLSLEAIRGNMIDDGDIRSASARIPGEIDIVANWEERDADFILAQDARWTFLNHHGPVGFLNNSMVTKWYLVSYSDIGQEQQQEQTEFPSWDLFLVAQQAKPTRKKRLVRGRRASLDSDASPGPQRRVTRQVTGAVKKRKWTLLDGDIETSSRPKRTRRTVLAAETEPDLVSDYEEEDEDEDEIPTAPLRPRRNIKQIQAEKPRLSSQGEDLQFALSVICIQVLAGGIDKVIDWDLVQTLFPAQEVQSLQRWWKTLLPRYRRDINILTEDFQTVYIDAFEQSEAPSIDFDNLSSSSWQGVVSWAQSNLNLEKLQESGPRLLLSREQLLAKDDFILDESKGLKQIYNHSIFTSTAAKERIFSSVVGGVMTEPLFCKAPVEARNRSEIELGDPAFAAARSCVLALIVAPDDEFDSGVAADKMKSLADKAKDRDAIVAKAVESLQRERLIVKRPIDDINRTKMRSWQVSTEFQEVLINRRTIQQPILKAAAAYKICVLDPAFSRGEAVIISKDAFMNDGEMVAVLNMISQGQIQIQHGPDVPNSRYGVDWQNVGYQTKLIDKSKVAFSTVLRRTSAYVYGDPCDGFRKAGVPRGGSHEPGGQFPLWVDICGNLHTIWWEMALAAVLGLLDIRPGIDPREIAHTFNWVLTAWEVDLILQWSKESGFASPTRSGKGWDTTDWWWMALGYGVEWK